MNPQYTNMSHRIVITGAPASGKTLFFDRLKNDRSFSGFIFFDELARQLLEENPDYRNNWPLLHKIIYTQQVERENKIAERTIDFIDFQEFKDIPDGANLLPASICIVDRHHRIILCTRT